MLVNKVTMSKAFAWVKPPAEKQKEVMTPSAPLTTGKEPKIHHGSSTWFNPSTANGLGDSYQPRSFSEVVKGTKQKETMDNSLDLVKPKSNQEVDTPMKDEKEVETKDLNKVATELELELVLPLEEIKEDWKDARQRKVLEKMILSTKKKKESVLWN